MNWVTTNIRLPEDVYTDLKLLAVRQRRSISSIIREKISQPSPTTGSDELLKELDAISKKIEKAAKGKNLTNRLLQARYKHV